MKKFVHVPKFMFFLFLVVYVSYSFSVFSVFKCCVREINQYYLSATINIACMFTYWSINVCVSDSLGYDSNPGKSCALVLTLSAEVVVAWSQCQRVICVSCE